MSDVIDELVAAMNAHDVVAVGRLIHADYRSEQPAHPGRAFSGRDQLIANWTAMFDGIPDFRAEIRRSVLDGDTAWTEWRWSGTRRDQQPFDVVGVTLFQVLAGQIIAGRLYLEEVETDAVSIDQAVAGMSGSAPERLDPRTTD